jgi:hypothetical protein
MNKILKIEEHPLTPESMDSLDFTRKAPVNPMSVYNRATESETISTACASRVIGYYALDSSKRNAELYKQGCAHVALVVKNVYDALVSDDRWTDKTRELFEAVNCGNIISVESLSGKPRRSDCAKKNAEVLLPAADFVVLEVAANARLYWDREQELHENSFNALASYTSADPGSFAEYERRFLDATENDAMGSVDVVVRRLEDGHVVQEVVRAIQKFVVQSADQYDLVQALYELCVWQFAVQAVVVGEWQTGNQENVAAAWAESLNKKVALVKILSNLVMTSQPTSTVPTNSKKPNAPTRFDRFFKQQKADGSTLTKKDMKVTFDALSFEEKADFNAPRASTTAKTHASMFAKKDPLHNAPKSVKGVKFVEIEDKTPAEENFLQDESDNDAADGDYDINDPDGADADEDLEAENDEPEHEEVEDSDNDSIEATPPLVKKPLVKAKKAVSVTTAAALAAPAKKRKAKAPLSKSTEPKTQKLDKAQRVLCKEVVHDLLDNGKAMFLWELFSNNTSRMVESKKPFTAFEDTPFEQAFVEYSNQGDGATNDAKFLAAKKVLIATPGIVHCFQMFNLMFKRESVLDVDEEEDLLMG